MDAKEALHRNALKVACCVTGVAGVRVIRVAFRLVENCSCEQGVNFFRVCVARISLSGLLLVLWALDP